ncbi:MAG: hypothetical protein ISS81_02765 [Candidatus Marinimicrobia bacterium]|nr:hypothetical protein [Candidatus Neomarinimicrobiota bacterium]
MNSLKLINLKLKQCDLADRTFDIFFEELQPTRHLQSIGQPHIIYPVIAQETERLFHIIYGFKIAEYCSRNEIEEMPAYILPRSSSIISLLLHIAEYHRQRRELYPFEIMRFLRILVDNNISKEEIVKTAMPALGIAANEKLMGQYLSLTNIKPTIINFLIHKNTSLKTWLVFNNIQSEAQKIFSTLISKTKPSLSIFEEIVTNLKETALRDNKNLFDIIGELGLDEQLQNVGDSPQRKLSEIREIVFKARYPVISKHKENIKESIVKIKMPPQVKIIWDKTFERKEIKVEFSINSIEDFKVCSRFVSSEDFRKLKSVYEEI